VKLTILAHVSAGAPELATMRYDVTTIREAREQVQAHLFAGWRNLTAEVVDEDGEVVAYYDRGWRVDS
jgi:hypothetical protein